MARALTLLLVLATLAGCALTQAAEKLDGAQLLDLVKQENSAGCIMGSVSGAHLGVAGVVRVIAVWGKSPPDPATCLRQLLP